MKQGIVIELDSDLAIYAAKIGKEYQLVMADSIMFCLVANLAALVDPCIKNGVPEGERRAGRKANPDRFNS